MSRNAHRQWRSLRPGRRRRLSRRRLTQLLLALVGILPLSYPLVQDGGSSTAAQQSSPAVETRDSRPAPQQSPAAPDAAPDAAPAGEVPADQAAAGAQAEAQASARAEELAPVAGSRSGTRPSSPA
ncbi:hypothetical protein E9564_17020, partial [Blastococcus sp. MG754427]|nr:hypothetical protein [Blastococcus sp. MG754427]